METTARSAKVRIVLGEMPGLLRDVLERLLAGRDDLAIVGVCESVGELRSSLALLGADIVVIGTDHPEALGQFVDLFRDHPDLRLLAIRHDARAASMHQMRIRRCRVADLSPPAILSALLASCDEIEATRRTPI